jgi:hypothetical protein
MLAVKSNSKVYTIVGCRVHPPPPPDLNVVRVFFVLS